MGSAFAETLDQTQTIIAIPMKALGFTRQGRTYNRSTADGIVQVVNLQMWPAPIGAPDPVKERVLGSERYGTLAVNLGIYVRDIAKFYGYAETRSIDVTKCVVRARLESLLGIEDFAWKLDEPPQDVARKILQHLRSNGLTFLDRWKTRESFMEQWIDFNELEMRLSNIARIEVGIMRASAGQADIAHKLFDEHLAAVDPKLSHSRGHVDSVRSTALRLGLSNLRSWP